MQSLLHQHRNALGVQALPQEYAGAIARTRQHLQSQAATLSVRTQPVDSGRLEAVVSITNRTGHKLPTAYPSRRAWLHLRVTDRAGKAVFESGALEPSGAIHGNDNDANPTRFEPHYQTIRRESEVQIYEAILAAPDGRVTTGLLTASQYAKDNRLLPAGFDKATARAAIAVHGQATRDGSFVGGTDHVRYVIDVSKQRGPFRIAVELFYQPIGYRWSENLATPASREGARFLAYYRQRGDGSAIVLERAEATAR